jgi:glutamine cyclotransferase
VPKSSPYLRILLPILALIVCAIGVAVWASGRTAIPAGFDYRIVKSYPHDRAAYCQGLVYEDGVLYEGTGRYGESTLRQVDLATGQVQRQVALDRSIFGEGITVWNDSIVQLSWKENVAFVYDKRTFAQTGKFSYTGEGWGITHDNRHWIVSDGSPTLRFFDPQTYQVVRRVTVRDGERRVRYLNELEYVQGEIWANIWYQDYLVRISPKTGNVLGYLDLSRLWPISERPDREAVLNGIAFDPTTGHLFVTGKNWPQLFELELIPRR